MTEKEKDTGNLKRRNNDEKVIFNFYHVFDD